MSRQLMCDACEQPIRAFEPYYEQSAVLRREGSDRSEQVTLHVHVQPSHCGFAARVVPVGVGDE